MHVYIYIIIHDVVICGLMVTDDHDGIKQDDKETVVDKELEEAFNAWKSKTFALTVPLKVVALRGSIPPSWIKVCDTYSLTCFLWLINMFYYCLHCIFSWCWFLGMVFLYSSQSGCVLFAQKFSEILILCPVINSFLASISSSYCSFLWIFHVILSNL